LLLQRHPPFSAVLAAAFFILQSPGAWGAELQKNDTASCGETPSAAIAAAEKALAILDAGGERAAITCLIEAVRLIEAAKPIVSDGPDRHELLRVPRNPGGPGKP
jgi:hypothetical protein